MNLDFKFYFSIFLVLIALIVSTLAAETIKLAEGRVSAFIYEGDLKTPSASAVFKSYLSKNVLSADLLQNPVRVYITNEQLTQFREKLLPGCYIFILKKERPEYDTGWDFIGVEEVLLPGEKFENGHKSSLSENEQNLILFEALSLKQLALQYKTTVIKNYINNNSTTFRNSETKRPNTGGFAELPNEQTNDMLKTPKVPVIPSSPESGVVKVEVKANPSNGTAPLLVNFDGSKSSVSGGLSITGYFWDFDASDGLQINATGKTATHTYNKDGIFIVTLTVTDSLGRSYAGTVTVVVGDNLVTGDIYVNAITGDDSNSGSSMHPLKTLTCAMTKADETNALTIHVADGTYDAANGEIFPIAATRNVTLLGESSDTIIRGSGSGILISINNINPFVVDTLSFQNAQIGMDLEDSVVEIRNSRFENMVDDGTIGWGADQEGGINIRNSTLRLEDSIFTNNPRSFWMPDIPASVSNITINRCDFSNATGLRSMILNAWNSTINITETSFHDSWGVYCYSGIGNPSNVTFDKCSFYGESSPSNVIALQLARTNTIISNSNFYNVSGCYQVIRIFDSNAFVRIYNNVFYDNSVDETVLLNNSENIKIKNNVFWGINEAVVVADVTNINNFDLDNNLFFNHPAHVLNDDTVTAYTVGGGNDVNSLPNCSGNIAGNPLFKNAPAYDFRPDFSGGSPLINAGIDDTDTPNDDFNGEPRAVDGISDIGSFEYQGGGADPIVSGRVYDSKTRQTVDGALVGIYKKNENEPFDVKQAGEFSFNVMPGNYYLIVKKSGYHFPSEAAEKPEAKGIYFQVEDGKDVRIDIPVDSGMWLELERTANKKELEIGEIVTVNAKIKNPYYYDDVHNVKLKDMIPPGFKYVKDSCRLNGRKYGDPVKTGKELRFIVGTVMSKQTLNLSYQMVVNTGATYSDIKSRGVCMQEKNPVSEEQTLSFEVIPDTLFYTGTVVGKVIFAAKDKKSTNKTGIELLTEYGLKIKTDENGKFHIPDVKPGRHILKVNPKSLPFGYEAGKPVLFDAKEGTLTKVEIKIKESHITNNDLKSQRKMKNINADHPLFIAALGEIEFKKEESPESRGAIYVEGEKKGFKVTASLDTDRLKDENKKLQEQKLYTRLPAEKLSPEYGDDAQLDYSKTETLDSLFLKIEKDDSYLKWGSLDIDYPYYRRVFQGMEGKFIIENSKKNNTEIHAYWAGNDQSVAFEEFNGTGGSIYYLKNRDVIEGSEKLIIQLKESLTQRIIREIPLSTGEYQIFYDQGRIILNKPLNTYISKYSQNIIQSNIQAGNMGILLVYYEYKTRLHLNQEAFGGRITQNIGRHIELSGQYVDEKKYRSPMGEIKYLFNSDSWIRVQYGESKGGFMYTHSYDGGISFSGSNKGEEDSGVMILVEAKGKVGKALKGEAMYSKQSNGFSALSSSRSNGQEKYYTALEYHLTKEMDFSLSHFLQKTDPDSTFALKENHETLKITKAGYDLRYEPFDFRVEYQAREIDDSLYSSWVNGQYYPEAKEMAAVRVGWQMFSQNHVYAGLQETIRGYDNDQYFGGGHFALWKTTCLNFEGRTGDIGDSISVGLSHTGEDDSRNSLSITGTQLNKCLEFSQSKDSCQFYNSLSFNNGMHGFSQGITLDNMTNMIKWGFGYENSSFVDSIFAINRESAALWYKIPGEYIENSGKVEWREDRQHDVVQTRAWYFEEGIKIRKEEGFSMTAIGGLGYAENPVTGEHRFDFTDLVLGFAYRPPDHIPIDILGKYIYLSDLFPQSRMDSFFEDSQSKKHVYSTGLIWNLLPSLEWTENIAFRKLYDKTGNRGWQRSETYLWINGLSYLFYKDWKLNLEYRILENKTFRDKKQGYLTEVLIPIKEVLYLGLGYNFTSFDDDLSNEDDSDTKGFFLRITGVM